MLSKLGRIGHFTAPPRLLHGSCVIKKYAKTRQLDMDILLLIIHFQVRGIPHSRYMNSIWFIYSIGPGLPRSCDDIRSLPNGLEFSSGGVCSILEGFPQNYIVRLKHPRPYSFIIRVCQSALVGRYTDCRRFSQLITYI